MYELAEPELFRWLVGQVGRGTQKAVAERLELTPAHVSRMVNGKADWDREQFLAAAPALALGDPVEQESELPLWVLTRLHANGIVEPPPLTSDGRLLAFANFDEAELACHYLRCFVDTGTPVVVPVWRSWLRDTLEGLGRDGASYDVLAPPAHPDATQDYADAFDDLMRDLRRGFVDARGRYLPS